MEAEKDELLAEYKFETERFTNLNSEYIKLIKSLHLTNR